MKINTKFIYNILYYILFILIIIYFYFTLTGVINLSDKGIQNFAEIFILLFNSIITIEIMSTIYSKQLMYVLLKYMIIAIDIYGFFKFYNHIEFTISNSLSFIIIILISMINFIE